MTKKFVVSVHVPKTAGTTLAQIFSACYNRRVIFDYDGYSSKNEALELISGSKVFVENYFHILHGHFYASKYFSVFPTAYYIATVRHPVERVISQFKHEMNEDSSDAWYHDDIACGRMDLPTFAAQPGIGDAMTRHLAGRSLPEYDLILVSEQMRLSLALFENLIKPLNLEEHFGSPAALPIENFGGNRKLAPSVTEEDRRAVYEKTHQDNELYAEAVSLLERRLKKTLK